ncbi:MAG: MliC family protein [Candidatus Paceibacterota bacterium]|jgi:membrane-bound inhibitor of C-type lysozyme
MKKTNIILLVAIYAFAFFTGFVLGQNYQEKIYEHRDPNASAIYRCENNKFIIADYYNNEVTLRLSDNRIFMLNQTISASGVRFTDKNEVFVFWNKGDTAFIEELGERTFDNCSINGTANY